MKPVAIGILVCLALSLTACFKRQASVAVPESAPSFEFGVMQSEVGADIQGPPLVASLPVDDEAKALGEKVFAKIEASLFRSPRGSATEIYRVPRGTALYVSPTQDPRWMQVRLSRGRSAFVRAGDTTAAMALAMAQGAIADRQRLSPRPNAPEEADAGDGKSSSSTARSAALEEAISDVATAFDPVALQSDRVVAEFGAFQGSQSNLSAARDQFSAQLSQLVSDLQAFGQSVAALSRQTGGMSAGDRNAFQAIVEQLGNANDAVNGARAAIDQMREGEDWAPAIAALGERVAELESAVGAIGSAIGRLE